MDGEMIRILLVEDNPGDACLVSEMLSEEASGGGGGFSFDLVHAGRLGEVLEYHGRDRFDVVLMDLDLPDSLGLETFRSMKAHSPSTPVVILTGNADEATGIRAVQEGAQDYLVKGRVDGTLLVRAIRYAIERRRTDKDIKTAASGFSGADALRIVGSSPRFRQVMELVSIVARTSRTSVLIQGETGTGKELIANSIHHLSARRENPFIRLNCSAIPENLLEAEMFGYEKGAFTDAKQSKKGLFELADGGTIFLDEIGDMELKLQPKLLQVLENRTFRKVGGVRDIKVDVRVVAATNKDLEDMVRKKIFREDLYYRLKVMVLDMPPLRERREDIIPLAEYYIRENCSSSSGGIKTLSPESRDILLSYHWPGNVRELKNTIERAVILCHSDEILPQNLPSELTAGRAAGHPCATSIFPSGDMTLEEMERRYIQHVLDKVGGNITKASEILGVSRMTVREKSKRARP